MKLGLIVITGQDAKTFLQGLLTCNVQSINETTPQFGALCNIQGRVIASGWLWQRDQTILWLLPEDLIELTHKTLKKYALFSKVTIAINPEHWQNNLPIPFWVNEAAIHEATEESSQDLQRFFINQGIALLSLSTSGQFTPHELGYITLGAVSFDKGCYLGQEIIARMHYRGKLKTHLHHVKVLNPMDISTLNEKGHFLAYINNTDNTIDALWIASNSAIKLAQDEQIIMIIKSF